MRSKTTMRNPNLNPVVQGVPNGEVLLIRNEPVLKVRQPFDITKGRKNRLCKNCARICKQSSRAKVITCPQFEAKDVK